MVVTRYEMNVCVEVSIPIYVMIIPCYSRPIGGSLNFCEGIEIGMTPMVFYLLLFFFQ